MQAELKKRLEEERDRHVAGYPGPRRDVAELLDDALSALSASIPADVEGLVERLHAEVDEQRKMGEPIDGPLVADAASALRSQAQRIGELEADVVEFMQRLDARWFLEQNWFPKTVTEGSDLSNRARAALAKEGNVNG